MFWVYGGPGTGKSRLAHDFANEVSGGDYYEHGVGTIKWWDGYVDQKCVILDDFRRDHLRECGGLSYLLRVLDRYGARLEVKGGTVVSAFEHVVITCPYDPVAAFTYHRDSGDDEVDENIG